MKARTPSDSRQRRLVANPLNRPALRRLDRGHPVRTTVTHNARWSDAPPLAMHHAVSWVSGEGSNQPDIDQTGGTTASRVVVVGGQEGRSDQRSTILTRPLRLRVMPWISGKVGQDLCSVRVRQTEPSGSVSFVPGRLPRKASACPGSRGRALRGGRTDVSDDAADRSFANLTSPGSPFVGL